MGDILDTKIEFGEMISEVVAVQITDQMNKYVNARPNILLGRICSDREGAFVHLTILTN